MVYIDPADLEKVSDDDLWHLYETIQEGAKNPAQGLGFDEGALNSIERMALGYYRAQRFEMAAPVYGFLLQMAPKRGSAWRGLGACSQSMKNYEVAKACYSAALLHSPEDAVAAVFLGECLCLLGENDEGLRILKKAIGQFENDEKSTGYVMRARAIVAANGGIPQPLVLRRHGKALVDGVGADFDSDSNKQVLKEMFQEIPSTALMEKAGMEFDEDREINWDDMQKNPELMRSLGELKEAVAKGTLTLAEIGGFTEEELEGAYVCACKYADMGQLPEAMQIAGYLIFVSPQNASYYQLVGICMQRLNQYDMADRYFGLAMALDKEDPMTLVYRGESQIMGGRVDEGVKLVKDGLEAANTDPSTHQPLIDRANVLIQQFGA